MTSLFDHLKNVYNQRPIAEWDALPEKDKSSYTTFMINRFVSMTPDYIEIVNISQIYELLGPRESQLYFMKILPCENPWSKYIKAKADDVEYPEWLCNLIARHFQVAKRHAESYLKLYFATDSGKVELREVCESYGTDPKLLKKAKL